MDMDLVKSEIRLLLNKTNTSIPTATFTKGLNVFSILSLIEDRYWPRASSVACHQRQILSEM